MNWFDSVFQTILGVAAVAALNRLVYHDRMIIAITYAVAVVAAYWIGRGCVKLARKRKPVQDLTDE